MPFSHRLCFHVDCQALFFNPCFKIIHIQRDWLWYLTKMKMKWTTNRFLDIKKLSVLSIMKNITQSDTNISSGWVTERTFYDLLKWPNDDNNSQFIKLQVLKQNEFNCYSLQSLQDIIRYKWFKRFPWNHFSLSISWKKIQRQVFVWNWL